MFKKQAELYERIKFCINRLKQIPDPKASSRVRQASASTTSSTTTATDADQTTAAMSLTRLTLQAQIKKEKLEFEAMLNDRRSSTCSNRSTSSNSKKTNKPSPAVTSHNDESNDAQQPKSVELPAPKLSHRIKNSVSVRVCHVDESLTSHCDEKNGDEVTTCDENPSIQQLECKSTDKEPDTFKCPVTNSVVDAATKKPKSSDYFVINPITNYFYYNRDVDMLVDEKFQIENEWVKAQFEKYGLVNCTVNVVDFTELSAFKGELCVFYFTLFLVFDWNVYNRDYVERNILNIIRYSAFKNCSEFYFTHHENESIL